MLEICLSWLQYWLMEICFKIHTFNAVRRSQQVELMVLCSELTRRHNEYDLPTTATHGQTFDDHAGYLDAT